MRAVRDTGGCDGRMARRRTAPSRARRRATGGARVQNAGSRGMSSAFRKDVARSIARSLGRFLALAGIVALGCGFYAGLRMTAPDMKLSADLFYDGTALMDVRVLSHAGHDRRRLAGACRGGGRGRGHGRLRNRRHGRHRRRALRRARAFAFPLRAEGGRRDGRRRTRDLRGCRLPEPAGAAGRLVAAKRGGVRAAGRRGDGHAGACGRRGGRLARARRTWTRCWPRAPTRWWGWCARRTMPRPPRWASRRWAAGLSSRSCTCRRPTSWTASPTRRRSSRWRAPPARRRLPRHTTNVWRW